MAEKSCQKQSLCNDIPEDKREKNLGENFCVTGGAAFCYVSNPKFFANHFNVRCSMLFGFIAKEKSMK